METITITLNGVEVSGHPGMTVLDLARESGVEIPTLCDDPNLTPYGACRLCMVEEERSGALLAACVSPIRSGMVINTRSPRVLERRKLVLELMLASHPDSCFVCDKGNRCQLRKLAADMGVGLVRLQRIPQLAAIQDINPFIERDLSKCILCAKCIRADQELVVEGAIDYINRGFASKPATLGDQPLEKSECTFCGTCVAMCPTGALREKETVYRGTTASAVETTCPFCGCGCGVVLEVKDNKLVRARPNPNSPVSHGALCPRGSYGYDFVHSPDRLTKPLIKVDGSLQPATWEQALERIAAELKRIKEKHGADSLAVLGSSKCTNEENYLLQRFASGVLGTDNIDNGGRLYQAARRTNSISIEELEPSDIIFIIGADPTASAPALGYAVKRAARKGTGLVLINIRATRLTGFARLTLTPRPGTDVALINTLANVILEEGVFKKDVSALENLGKFRDSLAAFTPEYGEKMTGVPAQDIIAAARLLAGAKRAAIVYGNGIGQQPGYENGIGAISNLALLTGAGVLGLVRENNARGANDMGCAPKNGGLDAFQMIEAAAAGRLKGMLIVGENPAASFPGAAAVRQALASLEFLAVSDMFLTETAKLATVVLPAASFAEKDGTFTNLEGRVQPVRKTIAPAGESLPDGEIVLRLARQMGQPLPYSSVSEVANEVRQMKRQASDGARLAPIRYTPPPAMPEDFPFWLTAGSILHHFGSGTRTSRASRLKKFSPRGWVQISPADAEKLGLADGDAVKVISPAGEVAAAIKVGTLPEGALFMPLSFPDCPANQLFPLNGASPKGCPARLERIPNASS